MERGSDGVFVYEPVEPNDGEPKRTGVNGNERKAVTNRRREAAGRVLDGRLGASERRSHHRAGVGYFTGSSGHWKYSGRIGLPPTMGAPSWNGPKVPAACSARNVS